MEICSGDSTPTSEASYAHTVATPLPVDPPTANAPGPPAETVPLKVDVNSTTLDPGPPTPTHSESQDCVDARKCKFVKLFSLIIKVMSRRAKNFEW